MSPTVPNEDTTKPLAGLPWYRPASASKPATKKTKERKRRAPHEKRWRDEPTLELSLDGGPTAIELDGPDDDGSLHFMLTGTPEPST